MDKYNEIVTVKCKTHPVFSDNTEATAQFCVDIGPHVAAVVMNDCTVSVICNKGRILASAPAVDPEEASKIYSKLVRAFKRVKKNAFYADEEKHDEGVQHIM